MSQIIKITDIESGKELEIVKGTCWDCCFCLDTKCKGGDYPPCILLDDLIFKEVTKKEEK